VLFIGTQFSNLYTTLDREAHAASRLDVLSAWVIRKRRLPLFGWKKDVFIRRNNKPYPIS
jgi:hypothetical protein